MSFLELVIYLSSLIPLMLNQVLVLAWSFPSHGFLLRHTAFEGGLILSWPRLSSDLHQCSSCLKCVGVQRAFKIRIQASSLKDISTCWYPCSRGTGVLASTCGLQAQQSHREEGATQSRGRLPLTNVLGHAETVAVQWSKGMAVPEIAYLHWFWAS